MRYDVCIKIKRIIRMKVQIMEIGIVDLRYLWK